MKKDDVILSLSGGGSRFIGLITAAYQLLICGLRPTIIIGSSAGAIAALVCACGKSAKGIDIGLKVTRSSFLSRIPAITRSGSPNLLGFLRILAGFIFPNRWYYLDKLSGLRRLIKQVIPKELFLQYQAGDGPKVIICTTNPNTRETKYWNIKDQTIPYEQMIDIIVASSAIAGVMKPPKIHDNHYYDGGHTEFSPLGQYLQYEYDFRKGKVSEAVAVYSQDKAFDRHRIHTGWKRNVFAALLKFTIPCYQEEAARNDHFMEAVVCRENKIKYFPIFIQEFLEGPFDTNPGRLKKGHINAQSAVANQYKPN
jgi:hypothetical protein